MEEAPFRNDLANGPDGAVCVWTTATDDVRIRVGGWRGAQKGTVLIFNGRTEYIEKYGRVAKDLAQAGYSSVSCDWRGQGLSDRVSTNKDIGHVKDFPDYQHDVAAFLAAAKELNFPEPYFLIGHSMGGAIGLRALTNGLPVKAAVFSAPMWGIRAIKILGPIASLILETSQFLGMGLSYGPGTNGRPYVLKQKFNGNALTHDPEHYAWLQSHIHADKRYGLGGPSLNWLRESKAEFEYLAQIQNVPCPTLAFVGTDEEVVVKDSVSSLANRWPNARLEVLENSHHEPLMELPAVRDTILGKTVAHFDAA